MDEPQVASALAVLQTGQTAIAADIGRLAAHVSTQNGRVALVEKEIEREKVRREERERTQVLLEEEREKARTHEEQQRRIDADDRERRFRWMLMFGLTAAGTISGVVFGVASFVLNAAR